MILITITLAALTIFIVYRFIKPSPAGTSAVEELKLRLARGEINVDTYRELKNELK